MGQSATALRNQGEYSTPLRYTGVAIVLHWLIAGLLVGQIAFGWFLDSVPRGSALRGFYVNLHKSTGLTLAVLILMRIAWRLLNASPPLPAFMPAWERRAARWSHVALYVCMLGMPLSGYIASNFSKYGVKLYNVLLLPPWGPQDKRVYEIFNTTHGVLSYLFVILIIVHITAAVSHAVRGNGIIRRILPARSR
jgi:cytochrome b561